MEQRIIMTATEADLHKHVQKGQRQIGRHRNDIRDFPEQISVWMIHDDKHSRFSFSISKSSQHRAVNAVTKRRLTITSPCVYLQYRASSNEISHQQLNNIMDPDLESI
jgi:hypothetical protein